MPFRGKCTVSLSRIWWLQMTCFINVFLSSIQTWLNALHQRLLKKGGDKIYMVSNQQHKLVICVLKWLNQDCKLLNCVYRWVCFILSTSQAPQKTMCVVSWHTQHLIKYCFMLLLLSLITRHTLATPPVFLPLKRSIRPCNDVSVMEIVMKLPFIQQVLLKLVWLTALFKTVKYSTEDAPLWCSPWPIWCEIFMQDSFRNMFLTTKICKLPFASRTEQTGKQTDPTVVHDKFQYLHFSVTSKCTRLNKIRMNMEHSSGFVLQKETVSHPQNIWSAVTWTPSMEL